MSIAFLPLCCPSRTEAIPTRGISVKGHEHWQLVCCSTSEEIEEAWPSANRSDDFWLSRKLFTFLADQPQGIQTEAILLKNTLNGHQILLTAQTFTFRAADHVSNEAKGVTSSYDLRRLLLSPFSFKVLCLGQFLTSGPFCQDGLHRLPATEAAELLPAIAETLMRCRSGYLAFLLKDLYPTLHPATRELQAQGHYLLPVDPAMTMNLDAEWHTTEDYLASLTSKYRVRYRRARGKLEGITRRRLSVGEVISYKDRLYALYQQICQGADFNAIDLQPDYFPWLAQACQSKDKLRALLSVYPGGYSEQNKVVLKSDDSCLHGYFNEEGSLIGFISAIPNDKVYHAHFLGLEDAYKQSHHLYHNMLFDLLDDAINGGFSTLDYGRTALEIKSSIGAEATDFAVFIKARYGWLNRLIPIFTPAVYTAPAWTARNPFRG
ncbi:hypothetical protein [Neolewinella persica]|uniref:hypothetical protein n=1 Tax=Neolewinella persica TaxID=70998 RepID=UPI0004782892|nr:hypothetical protein [Neolewinella persica]